MDVNIYTYSSIRGPKARKGAIGYILETETAKGPATLTKFEAVEDMTGNQSELVALRKALKRLNRSCNLHIYTNSDYVASAITKDWVKSWQQSQWKKPNGEDVANSEEWQKTLILLNTQRFQIHVKEHHEYSDWLMNETEKKAKEKDNVIQ